MELWLTTCPLSVTWISTLHPPAWARVLPEQSATSSVARVLHGMFCNAVESLETLGK